MITELSSSPRPTVKTDESPTQYARRHSFAQHLLPPLSVDCSLDKMRTLSRSRGLQVTIYRADHLRQGTSASGEDGEHNSEYVANLHVCSLVLYTGWANSLVKTELHGG